MEAVLNLLQIILLYIPPKKAKKERRGPRYPTSFVSEWNNKKGKQHP